jgi:hypothetical protein
MLLRGWGSVYFMSVTNQLLLPLYTGNSECSSSVYTCQLCVAKNELDIPMPSTIIGSSFGYPHDLYNNRVKFELCLDQD